MFDRSLIKRSRQLWKVYLGLLAMPLGGLAAIFLGIHMRRPVLSVSGVAAAVAGVAWALFSVACPRCEARLLWKAITRSVPAVGSPG